MEILQAIWTSLTTENQNLIKIIAIPFSVIEAIITMLLFTTILIYLQQKSKSFYMSLYSLLLPYFL